MMNKGLKVVSKIILSVFAFLLVMILLNIFILYTPISYTFNPVILLISVVIYVLLVVWLYKILIPKIENKQWISYVLIGVFALLCLLISYLTRLQPKWDMGTIYNLVVQNVTNDMPYASYYYLHAYPHNLMITAIWTMFLKIVYMLNITTDYITVITALNSIIVTLTVALMYKTAKKIGGRRKAILILWIAIFTTPLYLHAAIYYSDAISAFAVMAAFYLYLIMKEQQDSKSKILYQILFGAVLWIRSTN